jgi:hypothetical protein
MEMEKRKTAAVFRIDQKTSRPGDKATYFVPRFLPQKMFVLADGTWVTAVPVTKKNRRS